MTKQPRQEWQDARTGEVFVMVPKTEDGIAEGYLSECEDQVRTLEWQLSEATKTNDRLRAALTAGVGTHGEICRLGEDCQFMRDARAALSTQAKPAKEPFDYFDSEAADNA